MSLANCEVVSTFKNLKYLKPNPLSTHQVLHDTDLLLFSSKNNLTSPVTDPGNNGDMCDESYPKFHAFIIYSD